MTPNDQIRRRNCRPRRNPWVILHPDGRMELDYYHAELSYNKYGGPKHEN